MLNKTICIYSEEESNENLKMNNLKIKLDPTCSYLEKVCRVLNPLGKSREDSIEIISL